MKKVLLERLQEGLIDALLSDLGNEDKCTPGLYTVVRGILNDHKDMLGNIPNDSMLGIEEALKKSVPFKKCNFDVEAESIHEFFDVEDKTTN